MEVEALIVPGSFDEESAAGLVGKRITIPDGGPGLDGGEITAAWVDPSCGIRGRVRISDALARMLDGAAEAALSIDKSRGGQGQS